MELRIRSAERGDAAAILAIYAPSILEAATSFEIEVPSVAEMEKRIEDLKARHLWLVLEKDGEILGYTYASPHRARRAYQWSVEVSVYVHAAARKRGVGRALYSSLFEVLKRQGYVNTYAGITLPNASSVRLHQAMGFVQIGVFPRIGFKFGKWHDVSWSYLRLTEISEPVPEPLPAKDLLQQEDIVALFRKQAQCLKRGRS